MPGLHDIAAALAGLWGWPTLLWGLYLLLLGCLWAVFHVGARAERDFAAAERRRRMLARLHAPDPTQQDWAEPPSYLQQQRPDNGHEAA